MKLAGLVRNIIELEIEREAHRNLQGALFPALASLGRVRKIVDREYQA